MAQIIANRVACSSHRPAPSFNKYRSPDGSIQEIAPGELLDNSPCGDEAFRKCHKVSRLYHHRIATGWDDLDLPRNHVTQLTVGHFLISICLTYHPFCIPGRSPRRPVVDVELRQCHLTSRLNSKLGVRRPWARGAPHLACIFIRPALNSWVGVIFASSPKAARGWS